MTGQACLTLLLLLLPGAHWVKVKDSYRIHRLYVTHYGNEIGGYYQPYKPSWADVKDEPFTAQCWEGKPAEFVTEDEAKSFVLNCPE